MLMNVIIGIVIVLVIAGLVYNYNRSKKIKENGIEVDAVVSRIKEIENEDSDGNRTYDHEYFVTYQNEAGETVIFVIETVGAQKVKKHFPDAVTVFLAPPSFEELRARITGRHTEKEEEIEKRLKIAEREMEIGKKEYDYVVVNDRLEDAVAAIRDIIRKEKEKSICCIRH